MSNVRFAVIDLDCNEPVAAFDSYDDANQCLEELDMVDVRCIIDTVELECLNAYGLGDHYV